MVFVREAQGTVKRVEIDYSDVDITGEALNDVRKNLTYYELENGLRRNQMKQLAILN